jgi:hypothetical protein
VIFQQLKTGQGFPTWHMQRARAAVTKRQCGEGVGECGIIRRSNLQEFSLIAALQYLAERVQDGLICHQGSVRETW